MPRTVSADLQEILKAYKKRETLVIYLADDSVLRLSRGKVEGEKGGYSNWIRSVSGLRMSIDGAIDRITIDVQNVTSEMGFTLASNLRLLDYATADYGRVYQSLRNPALIEHHDRLFRGVLANAEADEEIIKIELIVDYESLGAVIASRGLSARCWWTYQNGIECTSSSPLGSCPKNRAACVRRGAEHENGGWEEYEEPYSAPPGSGGNEGGGIGGGNSGPCFTLDTLIWTPAGEVPIGDLPVGKLDKPMPVVSFNEHTGEISFDDEILEVFEHDVTGYFTLEFEHGSVNVTPEHPFFRELDRFTIADQFRLGDTTMAVPSGDAWCNSRLLKIRWNSDSEVKVRNLHVRKNNTYFANRYGVHNTKPLEGPLS